MLRIRIWPSNLLIPNIPHTQLAIREARHRRHVLYVATAPPFDRTVPAALRRCGTDPQLAARIRFEYVRSVRELALRLVAAPPDAAAVATPGLVIVEQLHAFCAAAGSGGHQQRARDLAVMLAALHDYASSSVARCVTVCSAAAAADETVLATLQRLFYFEDNCFAHDAGDPVYAQVQQYLWNE